MEQKNQEPTLTRLMNELDLAIKSGNGRSIVLNLQLHSEHYVNEIVSELIKNPAKEIIITSLVFPKKLEILKKIDILNDKTKNILLKLNEVRDFLVHNLIIDEKVVSNKLNGCNFGFNYSWEFISESGKKKWLHSIDLSESYKNFPDKFVQMQISVAVIIGILYHRLKKLRKEFPNQFITLNPRKEKQRRLMDIKVIEAVEVKESQNY